LIKLIITLVKHHKQSYRDKETETIKLDKQKMSTKIKFHCVTESYLFNLSVKNVQKSTSFRSVW